MKVLKVSFLTCFNVAGFWKKKKINTAHSRQMYITKENSALREKALVKLHKLMKLCILEMNSFYQCVKKKYSQVKFITT